jgi:hypothetical protein
MCQDLTESRPGSRTILILVVAVGAGAGADEVTLLLLNYDYHSDRRGIGMFTSAARAIPPPPQLQ